MTIVIGCDNAAVGLKNILIAYLEKLRMLCLYLGISDCKLQEGSMRVDVNLSVKEAGSDVLGTRTEMKNLNSFKAITRAIGAERERQIALIESGKAVEQETRRWDDAAGVSYSMRSKEDSKDYRYFPEPDVPIIATNSPSSIERETSFKALNEVSPVEYVFITFLTSTNAIRTSSLADVHFYFYFF